MRRRSKQRIRPVAAFVLLIFLAGFAHTSVAVDAAPLEVLKAHVDEAVRILEDPAYADTRQRPKQREALCAVAADIFDVYAFSRLVLASGWQEFDEAGQQEFVDVFSEFLCRYYISRLQLYYGGEELVFLDEEIKSPKRASVHAQVQIRGLEIPIEVRMGFREGRWRAFDIVVSGISAVLVYRAQFQPRLLNNPPRVLIEELKERIAAEG